MLHVLLVLSLEASDPAGAVAPPDTTLHTAPASADTTVAPPRLPSERVRAWQTGLLRPDRLQHASLSATDALAIGLVSRRPGAGLAASLVLGLGKEVWDRHRSGFDPVDLAADAVGAALGSLGAAALDR